MRTRWSAICVVLAPPPRRMRAPTGAIDMHLVSTRRGATRDEMIVELYAQVLAEESTTASVDDYARHRLRLVRRDTAVPELTALRSFVRCDGHPVRALFTVIWETSLRIGTLRRLKVAEHYTKGAEKQKTRQVLVITW